MITARSILLPVAAFGAVAHAQSLMDITEVRNPVLPWRTLFEVEAGVIGTETPQEDAASGLASGLGWDGHVYYRDEDFRDRTGTLVGYAGRDGIYAGLYDGQIIGNNTISRLELRGRPWQFYRDGAYRGRTFVPNGLYEGADYEGYLGFGREIDQGLYFEFGPYYRDHSFSASSLTPGSFTLPSDFAAYGARLFLEQNTTQLDRRRNTPLEGGVLTIVAEQEWNDSADAFGAAGFTSELPSQVWRARGRFEWYFPAAEDSVWEVFVHGVWRDKQDRVQNFEAQQPLGHQTADGALRLRFQFGDSFTLTPYAIGQYSRIVGDAGGTSDNKFFFGGGVESWFHFNSSLSLHGWYSYMNNESRPSIRINEDMHGEHMFYLGIVMRFGGQRR
ncbi:MAG: hypothetical protein U1E73_04995 [Planctomycetota bacterium]